MMPSSGGNAEGSGTRRFRGSRFGVRSLLVALLIAIGAASAVGQFVFEERDRSSRRRSGGDNFYSRGYGYGFGRGSRAPVAFAERDIFPGELFTFCTVWYRNMYSGGSRSGRGWGTDYPSAGHNLMLRLEELTTIQIKRDEFGDPAQAVVRLTDEALFNYPFIFLNDVGKMGLTSEEAAGLGSYLLRGGFLYVDDFWGEVDWINFATEFSRVLPPDEYPIVDIPLEHELFNIVFNLNEVPQVPSIHHWNEWGSTSELGPESAAAHCRGVFDKNGRLMAVMTHNTDIADGWEREAESMAYFEEFSVKKAYPLGINIVVYAMTH